MDNDHILIIFDFSQLNVEVSVGQAEEVALPDVGVQEVSTFSISSTCACCSCCCACSSHLPA